MKVMYPISRVKAVRFLGLCALMTAAGAGVLKADFQYADDFTADRAELDSYRHSAFWSRELSPLPEPYLSYLDINRNRGLAFFDHKGRPAELAYRFPPDSAAVQRVVSGVLVVDVAFPWTPQISQSPAGWLQYSLSADGVSWSTPEELYAGHQVIPLGSPNGVCYVLLSGARAVIDNVSVSLQSDAVTIRVPQNFPTIQAAINAAHSGDVIEVARGVYSGPGNRDIDFLGKAITVCSAAGSAETIIDCGGSAAVTDGGHRGFYFHQSEGADSVLSGFTVRGGRIFGFENPPDPAQWISGRSHPIGGGIYCEFSSPTIVNCVIRDCGTQIGGGIGGVGTEALITNCVIEDCIAGGYDPAKSGGRGGAIGLIGESAATITNCVIRNNSGYSNSYGGGLYVRQSSAVVAGCTISGNAPSDDAPGSLQGGGAYCSGTGTDVTFRNCIFTDNRADVGAGLYLEWLPDTSLPPAQRLPRCHVEIINCTIAGNVRSGPVKSPPPAGGIQAASVDILVISSILWANTKTSLTITDAGSAAPVTYCDVEGGYPGTGNINKDPLFADMADGDFHLKSKSGRYDPWSGRWVSDSVHSACIDAGDPEAPVGDEPVPNGGRINMGAYGGTSEASNGAGHLIYHVDGSSGRDNGNDGLSRTEAFATIQEAIYRARDGDTIVVWPGVYRDPFVFMGKAITVQSAADAAVLTAPGDYAVSFYYGEGPGSVLANFVITGCGVAAIFCEGTSPSLRNLTIVGNNFGIVANEPADPNITNCILWDNQGGDLSDECTARYSDIKSAVPEKKLGNIRADPLFADPQKGDYHLKSESGRYVPQLGTWVADDKTSPCIDAGNPDDDYSGERIPNGDRIDMGAHGGTPFASLSES